MSPTQGLWFTQFLFDKRRVKSQIRSLLLLISQLGRQRSMSPIIFCCSSAIDDRYVPTMRGAGKGPKHILEDSEELDRDDNTDFTH